MLNFVFRDPSKDMILRERKYESEKNQSSGATPAEKGDLSLSGPAWIHVFDPCAEAHVPIETVSGKVPSELGGTLDVATKPADAAQQ